MNINFGIWRPNGPPVQLDELLTMATYTRRFAHDEEWFLIKPTIGFGVQAQFTHARSRLEVQPTVDKAHNVVLLDGRLDNYRDLLTDLDLKEDATPDSQIVLHAYLQWGSRCFARLIGDWSLVLWDSDAHTLYLARDHAGTRTLHYSIDATGAVIWATFLDSYQGSGRLDTTDPVYLASYLALLPCYARTPYRDVQSILPGHFLSIRDGQTKSEQFWSPALEEEPAGITADDYDAQFLHLFRQSVARRTGTGAPILAELSGGMDSSAIVCVADRLRAHQEHSFEPLQTLSYFDDSEADWNERPYFTLVEKRRGQAGLHIDMSQYRATFNRPFGDGALYLYPSVDEKTVKRHSDLQALLSGRGYKSILSGIGGDEFTGGNPNPAVEVADFFLRGHLVRGVRWAIAWCIERRISIVSMLGQSAVCLRKAVSSARFGAASASVPWLTPIARRHCETAILELPFVTGQQFHLRPRTADVVETWWLTLRTQPHLRPSEIFRYEYRYPYLDRDFLEFLIRLPPEQLSRPGRRRFLMRKALKDIVPDEILERRRKAFLLASRLAHFRDLAPRFAQAIEHSMLVAGNYADRAQIRLAIDRTIKGEDLRWWGLLLRFAALETWLGRRQHVESALLDTDFSHIGAIAPSEQVPVA